MENVIVLGFARKEQAEDALRALRRLHHRDDLRLEAAAVVQRSADGRVRLHDLSEDLHFRATATGGAAGALIGLLTGPVGVLLGGATGAAVGSLVDVADSESADGLLRRFGQVVPPGSAATIAVVHEPSPVALNRLASDLAASLSRRRRADIEREILEEEELVLAARRGDDAKRTLGERVRDVKDAVLDRR